MIALGRVWFCAMTWRVPGATLVHPSPPPPAPLDAACPPPASVPPLAPFPCGLADDAGTYVPSQSAPAISAHAEVDARAKIHASALQRLVRAARFDMRSVVRGSMSILRSGRRRRPGRPPLGGLGGAPVTAQGDPSA